MSRSGINGRMLNRLWNVGAKHALYHETGEWYHKLTKFPGALFDKFGYVMFETEEKFRASPYLQIKKHVNLSGTIKDIPDYVQFTQSGKLPEISQEMQEKRTRRKWVFEKRIIRDTKVVKVVKELYDYQCQICGETLRISGSELYAEGHHIQPLGGKHDGPDIVENILCVCPNHHVLLDKGAIRINLKEIHVMDIHLITRFVDYHNKHIFPNRY